MGEDKREGGRERKRRRERERMRNGMGEMWELCFCFFAIGYIYNYFAGIKWPIGFFNKSRRHLQYKILPTSQHIEERSLQTDLD